MRSTTITARTRTGEVPVKAWKIPGSSDVMVTRATWGPGYVITHVPTGMCVPRPMSDFRTIADARDAYARWVNIDPGVPDVLQYWDMSSQAERSRIGAAWRDACGPTDPPPPEPQYISVLSGMAAVLAEIGADDWDGDADTVTCPCGYVIELDGACPEGHVSPLRAAGLI